MPGGAVRFFSFFSRVVILREGRAETQEVESGSRARHTLNSLRDSAHAHACGSEALAVTVAICTYTFRITQ